jgi:mono/diheme cytochrome c family protein
MLAGLGGLLFWLFSAPQHLSAAEIPDYAPRPERGERIYHVGGCISCHKPPEGAAGLDATVPSGGQPLKTPLGLFYPPNLTPDAATGLGNWTDLEFVNAMMRGVSRGGRHYFPVFPYTSYIKMRVEDVLDLRSYLDTLPPVRSPNLQSANLIDAVVRRGIGLWKRLALDTTPPPNDPARSESWNIGAYLVNAPGHCGECHTPRNFLMISDESRRFAGGPHPVEEAKVRSLRGLAARGRYKDIDALVKGFKFYNEDMDSGGMGSVQSNLQKLSDADLVAIAEYLMSLD